MSISNISVGASFAGIQAHKARHEMNGSIMRLSSEIERFGSRCRRSICWW